MNSPVINELATESSSLALLHEFLRGYFDGNAHVVGSNLSATVFPLANLTFQQAATAQPLNGLSINCVMLRDGMPRTDWTPDGNAPRSQVVTAPVKWLFFVRARGANTEAGNPDRQVMTAAELLFGLLRNAMAVKPLAEKGILHLRPAPSEIISQSDYAMRVVTCHGKLRYALLSQPFDKSITPDALPAAPSIGEPTVS